MRYPKPKKYRKPEKRYYLDNPADKQAVKDFEQEFNLWLKGNPKHKNNPFSYLKYYESLGAIRIYNNDIVSYSIEKLSLYKDLEEKWSVLGLLRSRRAYAQNKQELEGEDKGIDIEKLF